MNALPVVTDSLDAYLVEISRFPLLSRDEEHTIARKFFDSGDIESAQKLVIANLRFVVKVALEFKNYGIALKDLIQEGNIGLMTAVKKFNPYKGVRLITYAVWWIKSLIQEYILKHKSVVKRSARALKKELFYRKDRALESAGLDMKALPSSSVSSENITDLSLNSPITEDGLTHLDMLVDLKAGQEEVISKREERSIVKKRAGAALALLSEKERFVMENRVMSDEPLSLQAIGDKLGLTRERIRQIEKSTLGKLKESLSTA
ncbi:MAG: sigma-70 family RNA polymerase sigma factor [Thermodesulfobacteriota bacterium]